MLPGRLSSSRTIRDTLARGRRVACPDGVVYVLPGSDATATRLAVVASRRIGSAVRRNRAKRRLRAAFAAAVVPAGYDVVMVARPPALTTPFATLVDRVSQAVRRGVDVTLTVAA